MDVLDELTYRPATAADVPAVTALVNGAYRGASSKAGWTTEADLLEGPRTDETEIASIIGADGSMILLCFAGDDLLGTVALRREDEERAHLGMLVVDPRRQASGAGKRLLAHAEEEVRARWGSSIMVMSVISVRAELIAFYERRGYRRTGTFHPFPDDALSTPQVDDLMFEVLEKRL